MPGPKHVSRRDFIKAAVGAIGGVITAVMGIPVIGYLVSPALREDKANKPVLIGNLANIPIGEPYPFSFTITKVNGWERTATSYGGFIWRTSANPKEMFILSSRCTHLSCRVSWHKESGVFLCPCHDASFGKAGEVLGGPPPEPLGRFHFEVAANGDINIIPVEVKEG